jgi:ferredoxin
MVYSYWSEYRAGSVAHTRSIAQVPGFDAHVKVQRSFRVSLEARVTFVVLFAVASALAGCSTGAVKLSNSQTPIIWVAMGQNLPGYMVTGTSSQVSAWVNNDLADAGVDWVVTCGNPGRCGSFSPAHSASGANTTFTAPTGVPPNSTLTISALSTTDHSKSASASLHVSSTVTGIVITSGPPASIPGNTLVNLSAIVFGDPANLGVDWTATCLTPNGPADCSSPYFSSRFGAGNNNITFTVPSTVATLGGVASLVGTQLTITARPTADHSSNAQLVFTVTAPISISMTQTPPATMLLGTKASLSAVVTNDTIGDGVTWSVACTSNSGDCGSVTPTRTGSGVVVTYTAPASVPSSPVTIEADATATSLAVNCGQSIGIACQNATATVNVVAPISVSITRHVPNDTIIQNASASLIATVSNDQGNAGVDWTVTCGSAGACGTFSPAHTASGAATTYTAPSAPPAANTITITATSTADPTKSDQEKVTVLSAPPLLKGQFVLYLNAKDSQNGPYILGGVITGDGNGNISRGFGHFEIVDASGNATISVFVTSPSTYSIGPDGRGQMTLTLDLTGLKSGHPNANFGVPVPGTNTSTLTLSVVFVTQQLDPSGVVLSEHALVTETDSFGDATGTLDLQNATDLASFSGLNGTYSLQLTGRELTPQYPAFFEAAALTIQGSGGSCTITGYTADESANGVISSVPFAIGSQVLPNCNADSLTGEIFSNIPVNLGLPQQFYLDFWLIDKNHFVVTDPFDQPGGPVLFGGYLTAQPTSSSFSGTFAFTEAGATAASATGAGQPQVAGGFLACGSTSNIDVVSLGGTPLTAQSVTATCTAPTNGRSSMSISPATGSSTGGISKFAAYPTTDGNFYLIELDGGAAGTSGPSGAGVAYQQTLLPPISASALTGNYATQFSATTQPGSQAFTGQIVSDGASTINGTVDVNSFTTSPAPGASSPSPGATLSSGTFTASANGRFPLTFTFTPGTNQPAPQIPTLHPACYIVDASTCLLLNLDSAAPGTGILQLQKDLP